MIKHDHLSMTLTARDAEQTGTSLTRKTTQPDTGSEFLTGWTRGEAIYPVMGKPLANTTLVINQNLKKLIQDFAATKRKAPIDEDIIGSDDDDEPAHRHATAGPSVAELVATSSTAAVDEAASSSSATAAPPRKRMKAPRRM